MDDFLDTVAGLPVHPLVVHAAVVLVPLAALGAIIIAFVRAASRRFGILVVIAAGAGAVASLLAKESGEQLAARVGMPQEHADLGDTMPIIAAALFVVVLVFWLVDRGVPMNRRRPIWLSALAVVQVLVAALAIYWMLRVGHSGAEAVWGSTAGT